MAVEIVLIPDGDVLVFSKGIALIMTSPAQRGLAEAIRQVVQDEFVTNGKKSMTLRVTIDRTFQDIPVDGTQNTITGALSRAYAIVGIREW